MVALDPPDPDPPRSTGRCGSERPTAPLLGVLRSHRIRSREHCSVRWSAFEASEAPSCEDDHALLRLLPVRRARGEAAVMPVS